MCYTRNYLNHSTKEPLIGGKHRNTQIGKLEAEFALLPGLDLGSLAVHKVGSTHGIHSKGVRSSQDGQVSLGTTTDTVKGQRYRHVGGTVVDRCLENVRVGLAVQTGRVVQGAESVGGSGWKGVGHDLVVEQLY